ncbi:hypothetical protein QBC46DRAFT_116392 [Diplogelasinospora grovesii]|uniref:Uncharacterized protein n=1 Tax=Diplogelasinospora grovesii TaxID=303347 RepID=A0AAN6NIE6_9PEZI|nr:hypothetical protein QBC46DRAFT_116392 [Diplogelasinospora grovesii]
MAGGFNAVDPRRCMTYAAFASHLGRNAFDVIYWLLFSTVIIMLFLSSWRYSTDMEAAEKLEPGTREHKNRFKKCILICSIYASISIVAVVMEVYALLALQFCDGEDLMSLYWSTWTMMQVGSLIAIFGIILAVFNGLRGTKNPPWALALGTPVLVVAGVGHAFHGAMRKRVQRVRSRSMSRSVSRQRGASMSGSMSGATLSVPMSRQETLRADESEKDDVECRAKLVGYTPEGAPILKFLDDPGRLSPNRGAIIGKCENGQVIVAFRKGVITINSNNDLSLASAGERRPSGPAPVAGVGSSSTRSSTTLAGTPGGRPAMVRIASSTISLPANAP